MKILQVITSLRIGGAEKLITEIAPLLRAKGHTVDVLALDGEDSYFKDSLINDGINVITLGYKCYPYTPKFFFGVTKIMRNYDVVHTHLTSPQLFVALGSIFSKKPILITTEHNATNKRRDSKIFKIADKWMYSRYQKIICISEKTCFNLHEYLPSLKNLCTIFNGVNVNRFWNASPIEGLHPKEKTVVTMVAAFRPQKDQKTLIDAIEILPKGKYELWIVGDGDLHDELHSYVTNKGMDDIVKFFGNRPDVPELLHTSDIIVMSSHYEGLSLSSIEGMSVGKPFIATDVDGLHEMVVNAGVLVPHQDSKTLASEIQHLSSDKDYYSLIANRCWEKAKSFSIENMVDQYEVVYKELLK